MIDLETLSTSKQPLLLQAGWCVFDPAGQGLVETSPNHNINIDSCLPLGGEISDGTLRFWLTQAPQARESVAAPGADVREVLTRLSLDYQRHGCRGVWSNGSCFDVVIVEHYMSRLGLTPPWKFWDIRDTRTLWALAETMGWRRDKGTVAHTAREDAVAQALQVQAAWAWVRGAADRERLGHEASIGRPPGV